MENFPVPLRMCHSHLGDCWQMRPVGVITIETLMNLEGVRSSSLAAVLQLDKYKTIKIHCHVPLICLNKDTCFIS